MASCVRARSPSTQTARSTSRTRARTASTSWCAESASCPARTPGGRAQARPPRWLPLFVVPARRARGRRIERRPLFVVPALRDGLRWRGGARALCLCQGISADPAQEDRSNDRRREDRRDALVPCL